MGHIVPLLSDTCIYRQFHRGYMGFSVGGPVPPAGDDPRPGTHRLPGGLGQCRLQEDRARRPCLPATIDSDELHLGCYRAHSREHPEPMHIITGPKLALDQIAEARERIYAGVPKALVARDLGVSRQTLYAALTGSGKYAALAGI